MTNRGDATNPARCRGRKRLRRHCPAPDEGPDLDSPHAIDDLTCAQGEISPQAEPVEAQIGRRGSGVLQ